MTHIRKKMSAGYAKRTAISVNGEESSPRFSTYDDM